MTQKSTSKLNDDQPLVSAIITYYERPKLLERSIRSVVNQSYSPIELVVIDDCSQPPSAESIIEGRELPVEQLHSTSVYRHEINRGVCEARNTGLCQSSGEYVAFLDDDDTWQPRKIEKQVHVAMETEVPLVYCGVRRTGPDGTLRATYYPEKDGNVIESLLCGNITGTASTILVDREVALKIDGFDPQFLRWNDWDFTLRIATRGPFGVVSDLLVTQYNSEEHQLSGDHEKLEVSAERLREKHKELAKSYNQEKIFYSWIEWGVGHSAMANGYFARARKRFLASLRYNPLNTKAYMYFLIVSGGGLTYKLSKYLRRTLAGYVE